MPTSFRPPTGTGSLRSSRPLARGQWPNLRLASNLNPSARHRGLHLAYALCRSHRRDRLATIESEAQRSIFRLGLYDLPPACACGDPSAPGAAAISGLRLWSTLRHRPAGNLRLTSKVHLPARPAMSLISFARTLHRRLAPPMSIRATLSTHLRNCTSGGHSGFHRRLISSGRASVLNLWFAPSVVHSGLAAAESPVCTGRQTNSPIRRFLLAFLQDHQLDRQYFRSICGSKCKKTENL